MRFQDGQLRAFFPGADQPKASATPQVRDKLESDEWKSLYPLRLNR
jgi:hypothetical protein